MRPSIDVYVRTLVVSLLPIVYRRHISCLCPTKVTNISNRTSIRERPLETDGTRFGDWEMKAASLPRVVNRLLFSYRSKGVKTITTDDGGEFACHELIEKKLRATVYFTDSYCSRRRSTVGLRKSWASEAPKSFFREMGATKTGDINTTRTKSLTNHSLALVNNSFFCCQGFGFFS